VVEIASNNSSFNNVTIAQRFMEIDDLFNQTITRPTLVRYYMIYEGLDLLYMRVYTQLKKVQIEEINKIRTAFMDVYVNLLDNALQDNERERRAPSMLDMMRMRIQLKNYYALICEGLQEMSYFFTTKNGERIQTTYKDSGIGEMTL